MGLGSNAVSSNGGMVVSNRRHVATLVATITTRGIFGGRFGRYHMGVTFGPFTTLSCTGNGDRTRVFTIRAPTRLGDGC